MTISPAKTGGWSINNILTSQQITTLQSELLKAVDGTGGGTYTPVAPIIIQGYGAHIYNSWVKINDTSVHITDDGYLSMQHGTAVKLEAGAYIEHYVTTGVTGNQTLYSNMAHYVIASPSLSDNATWTIVDAGTPIGGSITFCNPCISYYVDVVYNSFNGTNTSRIQKANSTRASITLTKVTSTVYIPTGSFSYADNGS